MCSKRDQSPFWSLAGVKSVNVDVPTKTVHVDFDETVTNVSALREAMATAGYMPD